MHILETSSCRERRSNSKTLCARSKVLQEIGNQFYFVRLLTFRDNTGTSPTRNAALPQSAPITQYRHHNRQPYHLSLRSVAGSGTLRYTHTHT